MARIGPRAICWWRPEGVGSTPGGYLRTLRRHIPTNGGQTAPNRKGQLPPAELSPVTGQIQMAVAFSLMAAIWTKKQSTAPLKSSPAVRVAASSLPPKPMARHARYWKSTGTGFGSANALKFTRNVYNC